VAPNESADRGESERFALIGRIAAGLAHELNGPIGVGIGFADLAREALDGAGDGALSPEAVQKLKDYLGLIEEARIRARTLTRHMWNFAKARPGETEDFDLVGALQGASDLVTPALKVSQIEARQEEAGAVETSVRADPVLCLQSFVEILLASPSALPDGGTVVWEAGTATSNGSIGFTIRGEPWGETRATAWAIPATARHVIEEQGGTIQGTESSDERGPEVRGCLPPGEHAEDIHQTVHGG